MYTVTNYKTKKQLKEDVASGKEVRVYQPNDFLGKTEDVCKGEHRVVLEGPHYPQPHRWYAEARVVDGKVVSVK